MKHGKRLVVGSRSCLNTCGARAPLRVHLRSGPGPASLPTSNLFPHGALSHYPTRLHMQL